MHRDIEAADTQRSLLLASVVYHKGNLLTYLHHMHKLLQITSPAGVAEHGSKVTSLCMQITGAVF